MTDQEIFNKVWDHFITQENPRAFMHYSCCYRRGDGARCAVGIFIPDALYSEALEGCTVEELLNKVPELEYLAPNVVLLCALQRAHDVSSDASLEKALRYVAATFALEVPAP